MKKKLFDYVIGNPPYQVMNDLNNRQEPVYHTFMDAVCSISNCVELITPARFLFNAGQTPKNWNNKMLNDKHFKVLHYEEDSSKIFNNVDIKGGVAITIRNSLKNYGKMIEFINDYILNSIVKKVRKLMDKPIDTIHYNRSSYKFEETLYKEHPELAGVIKKSEQYAITSNIFDKAKVLFSEKFNSTDETIQVYGRQGSGRTYKKIRKIYIRQHENLGKWKIFLPKSNGTGKYGEVFSAIEVAPPNTIATQTFISFGAFSNRGEAETLRKYIMTKFVRAMLGVCKVTPDNARKEVWRYVPLQDFTASSDIDWSKSIHEIDLQLYRKYGLDEKEIAFIETHVKEMA